MTSIDLNSLLIKYGLLCHTFAFNELPRPVKDKLGHENHVRFQDCYLSLIANFGSRFWTELKANQHTWIHKREATDNPVDYFSAKVTSQLLKQAGLTADAELLYPGTAPAPLMLLGELANWSTPSPLGLGLHTRYGPWFAYRALVKTTNPLQVHGSITSNQDKEKSRYAATSPCLRCASTACVTACPGNAVSISDSFNISRCATYRLNEQSVCKDQCHARDACPVGVEYRYSDEQHKYHMTHALQALLNWAD